MSNLMTIRTRIGRKQTSLLPVNCFDPVMLPAPDAAVPCILGQPPEHLSYYHWPALVDECYDRFNAVLERPVTVEQDGRITRFGILGVLVLERGGNGLWRSWQWLHTTRRDDLGPTTRLERVSEDRVVVDGLPYKAAWTNQFVHGLSGALSSQWHPTPQRDAYRDWILAGIVKLLWTPTRQKYVRAQVARALELNPQLLRRARRHYLCRHGNVEVRLADYNRMLWRARRWPRIQEQTPQFVWLLNQLWDRLPPRGDLLQELKHYLTVDWEVSPRIWKLLHREGTTWMRPLLHYYTLNARRSGSAIIDLLHMASVLSKGDQLAPMWLFKAVMGHCGNPSSPQRDYASMWGCIRNGPVLARVAHWYARLQASGDEAALRQLQAQLPTVLHGVDEHTELVDSRWIRQVSLKGLIRRAADWDEELHHAARQVPSWPPRTVEIDHARWRVVELTSVWDILQEARTMRHCADTYMDACRDGRHVILSVRQRSNDKRVATVGLERDPTSGKLSLDQIAGFANGRVMPEIRALAERYCTGVKDKRRMFCFLGSLTLPIEPS